MELMRFSQLMDMCVDMIHYKFKWHEAVFNETDSALYSSIKAIDEAHFYKFLGGCTVLNVTPDLYSVMTTTAKIYYRAYTHNRVSNFYVPFKIKEDIYNRYIG